MNPRVSRRGLLRASTLAAAGLVARRIGAGAQAPGQAQAPARPDSASADPLFRPDLVQQRGAVLASDNDPVIKDLEHRLKCTCGCNLDIYTCRTTDFTCTYSPALHGEVVELRKAGKSPDQVVAAFVSKYGEQILMAPPPQGFNLAGYLVPGVLVAVIGSVLAAVLVRRSRRMAQVNAAMPAAGTPAAAPVSREDSERLRQALADVRD